MNGGVDDQIWPGLQESGANPDLQGFCCTVFNTQIAAVFKVDVSKAFRGDNAAVKQGKSGQRRPQNTTTEGFDLPVVDPDFLIIDRDPKKLHAYARGLLNRLRQPSRSYSLENVKAATVWLVGAYVEAQVPLAPEMSALVAGIVKWQRRASTFRKVQEDNEQTYWAAIRFEASNAPDRKGKAPSAASLYAVAKHVLQLEGAGLPRQGTRIPRNPDSEPDPNTAQKSAEATIRGWREIDHYRQNVHLQRHSISYFKNIPTPASTRGVKK